ncbi:Splicing factor [Stygiomarasmius scandens]|uniref:Splicing factor n=1 Tax=Marasmiellus scandens TaxID=2682957 RepID=A0ABR1K1Z4_9AGAR
MDEQQSLEALANILNELSEKPFDFSLHAKHVRLTKSEAFKDMEAEAVSALEMFTNYFAAGDEVWLDLLDAKERSVDLSTVNGAQEVLALYERAEEDHLSIPILKQHMDFVLNRHSLYVNGELKPDELGELFSTDWTRLTIGDIAKKAVGHLSQSCILWDRVRDWELEILESAQEPERTILVEHVQALLLDRLGTPHSNSDETLQAYSSFTTQYRSASEYEDLLVAASTKRSKVAKAFDRRAAHETAVSQPGNTLDAFVQYISYERKAKYPDMMVMTAVYERAIAEAAKRRFNDEPGAEEALRTFWTGYCDALRLNNVGKESELKVFQRAIRSVPACGEVWARYIRCLERYTDPEHAAEGRDIISNLYNQAFGNPLLLSDVEQIIPIVLARVGFEKRLIDTGMSDDDTLPTLIGVLESGIEATRKASKEGDSRLRLEKYLAEIYRIADFHEAVVGVWQSATKHYKNSYLAWTHYTDALIKRDQLEEARKVFSDVSFRKLDWPEAVWEAWISFEHLHGQVEQVDICIDRIEQARQVVNARRAKEAKESYQAMAAYTAQQSESQLAPAVSAFTSEVPMEIDSVESAATGRGTKRPAFEEPNAGEHEAQKKPKLENKPEPLKRDRENCTVFVAELPANATDQDLTELFKDCGVIREVKITQLVGTVVATVEFLDRDAVPAALTKDKKRIHEQEIAVHLAWQSTLYVTNFPESTDDAYIRDIFGKYGTIFDVRWPSKKFKTTRRFCYIQYTSPAAAQQALELHGRELEPERAINVFISNPERKKERTDQDADNRELYVAGLSKFTTKADLEKLFSTFGHVKDIRMGLDKDGKSKGFAFIEFEDESTAQKALSANNHELRNRHISVTISDPRVKAKNRNANPDTGFGRKAEITNRSVRVKNLPPGTQEGLLQQAMEKLALVKRVEVFTDKNEAVVELENAAEAGKLLLQTEPIVFNGATLQLLEESQAKTNANGPDTSGLFVPRTAASRPKAGIGHKRKVVQPIHSAPSESKSNADASSSSAPPASKKGQDDFRKMLDGK